MTYKLQLVDEAKKTSNRAVARKYGFDESLIRYLFFQILIGIAFL